jgi:hypothetical protein
MDPDLDPGVSINKLNNYEKPWVQLYGFKDPDSAQNVTDPEHCLEATFYHILSPV